jgi:ATP-dependent Clp protease protease subunit
LDKVKLDTDRDFFMGADETKEYGLVDEVLSQRGIRAA